MHTCVNQKKSKLQTSISTQGIGELFFLQQHRKQSKSNQAKWWSNVGPCNPGIFFLWRKELTNRMLGTYNTRTED